MSAWFKRERRSEHLRGRPPGVRSLTLALAVALETAEHETPTRYWLDDRLSTVPSPASDVILYRIAQDAISNIRAHAQAANVTVSLLERHGMHVLRVIDDGVGFADELSGPPPLSCGLDVMHARAQLAGGGVSVASTPGCGTVVEAWLPVNARTGAGGEPGTITVLIAEDNDNVRAALTDLIGSDEGLEVIGAVPDAAQAIAAARHGRPTVALLDVRMPGGGATAARGIKEWSPETRVIALSAYSNRARVLEMLEAGADGYLVKGTSAEGIIAAIRAAASGQGSLSAEVTTSVIHELAGELHLRRFDDDLVRDREERVRRALREAGVLRMVFQPICTLSGEIAGAEALARFACEPLQGPDRWFAEAAEIGLQQELEIAAARAALVALRSLPEPLYLTINASPATVASTAFRQLIEQIDASRVILEITEHARIDDYDSLRDALATLRALGARIAIDDAGAGFASLRHILRLRPEFIKLDRALIDHIETDDSLQALASGLIFFAAKIDSTIIAEGIERPEEVAMLEQLGVRFGQGYYFARPAPLPLQLHLHDAAAAEAAHARGAA